MANQQPHSVHDVDVEDNQGFVVLKLHYSADPDKDAKWAAKVKKEYATDDWLREFELKPIGTKDSYPVFVDYKRSFHEDDKLLWQPSRGRIIYRGWDFGKVHPCVIFAQVYGVRKNYIDEIYEDNILIEPLIQKVLTHSNITFPNCTFVDWVDVSGRNEDQWGNSSIGTMKKYGLHPRGRDQTIEEGIQKMKQDMVMLDQGRPYLMVNPVKCPHLVTAFRGAYKRNIKGEIIKDGTSDHPVDAARYLHTGVTQDASKDYSAIREKIRNQYKKFPAKGKTVRR
jgi:hypothetical protein